jgi:hypothetical protein
MVGTQNNSTLKGIFSHIYIYIYKQKKKKTMSPEAVLPAQDLNPSPDNRITKSIMSHHKLIVHLHPHYHHVWPNWFLFFNEKIDPTNFLL